MTIKSKIGEFIRQVGTIFKRFPAVFQPLNVLGKVFGVAILFIALVTLYSTWHSSQLLRYADEERISNLNHKLSDYQYLWNEFTGNNLPAAPTHNLPEEPLPEHINTRSISVDFSKDYLYLDLSLSMSKESDLAKSIVDGTSPFANKDFFQTYFGNITWTSQEISLQYIPFVWEIDDQKNELIVRLQQKYPHTEYVQLFGVEYQPTLVPENDLFKVHLDDGFRLTSISPFPDYANPVDVGIKGVPAKKLDKITLRVEADYASISVVRRNEWVVFISNLMPNFKIFRNTPYEYPIRSVYYIFPLLIFLFWPFRKVNTKYTTLILSTTGALLILYTSVFLLHEISYQIPVGTDNFFDFFPMLLHALFWSTEFWEETNYIGIWEFQFGVMELAPILLGLVLPAVLLSKTGELDSLQHPIIKRTMPYWRLFSIGYLSIPLFYGLIRWLRTGFFSAGDLILVLLFLLSILMYLCIYGIYYLMTGKYNIDISLLVLFLATSKFAKDLIFWINSEISLITSISVFLNYISNLWDKFNGFIYLYLFIYSILSLGIFALSETNWKLVSTLRHSIKRRLLLSAILTLSGALLFSFRLSSKASLEEIPYANLTMDLATILISSVPYLWGILILIYLSMLGNDTTEINGEARVMGIIASGTFILASPSYSFPTNLILGVTLLFFISRRSIGWWQEAESSHRKYFQDPQTWIDKAVNLTQVEKAYKEFRKKHYEKLVDNSINAKRYEKDILSRKKEVQALRDKEFAGKNPRDILFSFGPYQSAFRNAWHGAIWSVLFAIPWMILFLPDLISSWGYIGFSALGEIIWNIVTNSLQLVFEWAVFGFLFGYFYCYWRGNNGLTKAFWFFGALAIPYSVETGLTILSTLGQPGYGIPTWFSVLFRPLQLLLHCLLLGVVAFEYIPIRKYQHDFQTLLEINGLTNLGVSISAILITLGSAIAGLLTNQTVELIKYALPTLFGGGGPTPPP